MAHYKNTLTGSITSFWTQSCAYFNFPTRLSDFRKWTQNLEVLFCLLWFSAPLQLPSFFFIFFTKKLNKHPHTFRVLIGRSCAALIYRCVMAMTLVLLSFSPGLNDSAGAPLEELLLVLPGAPSSSRQWKQLSTASFFPSFFCAWTDVSLSGTH